MNQPTAQAFGTGQADGGERPILKPVALFDLQKKRVPAGKDPFKVDTRDRRASRMAINVFAGLAYVYFSSGGGYSELPDLILTEGTHVIEFAPRPVQLAIFNGRGDSGNDDLFVSVILTNPVEDHGGCGCGCGGKG